MSSGWVRTISYGNQARTEYTYHETDQVESLVTVTKDGQVLLNYQYAYDGDGNCIQKSGTMHQNAYAYDVQNRLTSASYDGKQEQFTYDLVGNRTSREYEGTKEYYHYNHKNQLTRLERANGFTEYQYDNQGNLRREAGPEGSKEYTYDALNHQTSVEREDGYRQINRYDGETLRYQTEENGKIIHFVFDKGQNLSVEEGETCHRIIRGHEPVAREGTEEGSYQYYTQDEQKSTMYLLDEQQEIKNTYRYDAFGNLLEKEEESINRLLYTGQMYDEAMGQYYLRARYYSPVIGRFLREDVYRGDGLNLYAYCGNHPVRYYDPSGYMKICSDLPIERNVEPDFIVAPGGVVYTAYDYKKMSNQQPSSLYHYTTEEGMQGIISTGSINPSIKTLTTKDARMGSGQYLTDVIPGSKTAGQTSRALYGVPWNTKKISNYIEMDTSGLKVLKGRDGVFYIANENALDIGNRIVSYGKTGKAGN